MKVKKDKVKIITLGCSKNLVDSEFIMAQIKSNDIEIVDNEEDAANVIINTCGFIKEAKEESIDTILRAVRMKQEGRLESVFVAGCLSDRYMSELQKEIPEVDRYFGATDKPHTVTGILSELGADYKRNLIGERDITTPGHFAYLKISEGCDNPCSFCAIPVMRGGHKSKPLKDILTETQKLASKGVREIIIIGQDTTYWGFDTDRKRRLSEVIEAVSEVNGIEWIRLMYAYPSRFPVDLIPVIRDNKKVCKYIDIPIQHITDNVLASMRRGITKRKLTELLESLRNEIPGIAIRTTLIVGYPDENEKDFEELYEFVGNFRFDRLGVFTYSHEEGTAAAGLPDRIPAAEKLRRQKAILELQKVISAGRNASLIGSEVEVIIDRVQDGGYAGRTRADAPEIDQEVYIDGKELRIGDIVKARVYDAEEFDLFAAVGEKQFSQIQRSV